MRDGSVPMRATPEDARFISSTAQRRRAGLVQFIASRVAVGEGADETVVCAAAMLLAEMYGDTTRDLLLAVRRRTMRSRYPVLSHTRRNGSGPLGQSSAVVREARS